MSALRIVALTTALGDAPLTELTTILAAARRKLVRPEEDFPTLADRLLEASVDPDLLHWCALDGDRAVGLIEIRRHSPEPGCFTVAVIAVAASDRHRGVGRALLSQAVARARSEGLDGAVVAGVHASNHAAIAFFESLGLALRNRAAGVVQLDAPLDTLPDLLGREEPRNQT